jgi:acyl dehydratase
MAMNRDYIGREYPPVDFDVTQGSIVAFAAAIGDATPVFWDRESAREAGFAAEIAPPTFSTIPQIEKATEVAHEPGLGLDWAHVLHGDQEFEWLSPLLADTKYFAISRIVDIRGRSPLEFITIETRIEDENGAVAVRARATLISREDPK